MAGIAGARFSVSSGSGTLGVREVSRTVNPFFDATAPEEPEAECECQDVERCPVHFGYD